MYPNEDRVRDMRGVTIGGGSAPQAQEARQPQVQRAVDELAKTAAVLAETIDTLEKRLSPVLMSAPPTDKGASTPKPVTVVLAESIHGQSEIIFILNRRLDSILSRLEL